MVVAIDYIEGRRKLTKCYTRTSVLSLSNDARGCLYLSTLAVVRIYKAGFLSAEERPAVG